MRFVKILGITFLLTLCFAVSASAGCYQAGVGDLYLLVGSILPYDDEGCIATTAFTGCSAPEILDNYISVSASYYYYDLSGNLATMSDSKSGSDIYEVEVRLEGTTDDGISATSYHVANCYVCDNYYSETLTENY